MSSQLGKGHLGRLQLGGLDTTSTSVPPHITVAGVITARFVPIASQPIRVAGVITATFIGGGVVTLYGSFSSDGAVVARFSPQPQEGFGVVGEVILKAYTRAGQLIGCISGPDTPLSAEGGSAPAANAVH